jgi:hypothetical protein
MRASPTNRSREHRLKLASQGANQAAIAIVSAPTAIMSPTIDAPVVNETLITTFMKKLCHDNCADVVQAMDTFHDLFCGNPSQAWNARFMTRLGSVMAITKAIRWHLNVEVSDWGLTLPMNLACRNTEAKKIDKGAGGSPVGLGISAKLAEMRQCRPESCVVDRSACGLFQNLALENGLFCGTAQNNKSSVP